MPVLPTPHQPDPRPDHDTPARMLGSNQAGLGEFNERVILHAIRIHGSLPKAELSRLTGLSTQTVSVIINRLLDEGYVLKRDSLRGKVGQPSQPIALHPDGAFSIGVQIGRRALDVVLLDFTGQVRWRCALAYPVPVVDEVFAAVGERLGQAMDVLGPQLARRVAGIGLAAPLMFGGWQELVQLSPKQADAWTRVNLRERLQAMTPLPVAFAKDTAAASVAELAAGRGRTLRSYLYLFIDTLVGGALVIDGRPHSGSYGNAGAIGSMPLAAAGAGAPGQAPQLLSAASLVTLDAMHARAGLAPLAALDERALGGPWAAVTEAWIGDAGNAIAFAINGAACLLDLDGVIIDGAVSRALLARLIEAVQAATVRYSWQGIMRPALVAGAIGEDAKVVGAAWLPLQALFTPAHGPFPLPVKR